MGVNVRSHLYESDLKFVATHEKLSANDLYASPPSWNEKTTTSVTASEAREPGVYFARPEREDGHLQTMGVAVGVWPTGRASCALRCLRTMGVMSTATVAIAC